MTAVRFDLHGAAGWPADDAALVDRGLGAANAAAAPLHEVQPLACVARGADGQVVGGAVGRTWGGAAELQQLWVRDDRRRQGLGSELLRRFEAGATARGAGVVFLETLSFQAPDWYAARGYRQTYRNPHLPHGITRLAMEKRLSPLRPGPATGAAPAAAVQVRRVTEAERANPALAASLAALLTDAVDGGASVGYLPPMDPELAAAWARDVLDEIGPGLWLWVAEHDGRILGSVQLGPSLKPNGRHRGEVMKLLVHRDARGRGIASRLLQALEDAARAGGLSLLVLDTLVGGDAEPIYRHLGWTLFGDVPGFALHADGRLHATACFYKPLG